MSSGIEAEATLDAVERADVVEPQLPQLVGRDRERKPNRLGEPGDEADDGDRHRDDDPPAFIAVSTSRVMSR